MDTDTRKLVQAIHDFPLRIVYVTAGAGTQALSDILGIAGATRTLLEAIVPYNTSAFDEFLGKTPAQYVAADTARRMAGRAYTRARWLDSGPFPVAGLSCTATIVTDRPKQGEHRAHISLWRPESITSLEIHLEKGARNREEEEDVVSRLILNTLCQSCEIDSQLPLPLRQSDQLEQSFTDLTEFARQLNQGAIFSFSIEADGRVSTDTPPKALLCGAFNPLHDGHIDLAKAAETMLGHPVAFELSAVNVDKPTLPPETILNRMAQFAGSWPIFASTAPTFLEKARLYPGSTFIVGYDTAKRIIDPIYYHQSHDNMVSALAEIRERESTFLVAGRVDRDGIFRHLPDLPIPEDFRDMFRPIPHYQFRRDISSTELRKKGQRGSR